MFITLILDLEGESRGPYRMDAARKSLLNRVSRVAKAEGMRGIVARVGDKAKQVVDLQYAYILVDPLVTKVSIAPKVVQVEQVIAEDDRAVEDLSILVEREYSVASVRAGILERLGQGELCYISRVDGQVVGHLWVRVAGQTASDFEQIKFYLAPEEVYYHDVYVVPEQRGKNITPTMKSISGREIAERLGKKQAVAIVFSTNHSSLRVFHKFGSFRIGVVGYFKLLGTKYPFIFRHRPIPL